MSISIFIFCVLYFVLSWQRLDWAVMFLIAALPAYLIRFSIFGIPSTLLEAMILISFAVWLIKNYKQVIENIKIRLENRKLIQYPFGNEIMLLLVISFFAAGISGFSNEALGIWKAYFLEPALFFILVLNIFKTREEIKKILWPLAVSALAVSAVAVYQKITGNFIVQEFCENGDNCRITSFFGYPNAVGLFLGPVILLLVGFLADRIYFLKNQKPDKDQEIFPPKADPPRADNFQFSPPAGGFNFQTIIIILAIIFSMATIYFAKSEGALIGVATGLVVFGIFAGKTISPSSLKLQGIKWITIGLAALAVAGIMAFVPAREYAVEKLTLNDFSGQVRKLQWQEAWEMLKDGKLIFGAGLANYQKAIAPYHQKGFFYNKDNDPDFQRKIVLFDKKYKSKYWQPLEIYLYPHNIILNFWAELGSVGALLFIWIIFKYFYLGIKLIKNYELKITNDKFLLIGLIGAMVVIIVHGLVDVPYFKNDLAVMFWVLLAIMGIISLELKRRT